MISYNTRREIFGHTGMVLFFHGDNWYFRLCGLGSSLCLLLVWILIPKDIFQAATMIIAVPTGIKVLSRSATLWGSLFSLKCCNASCPRIYCSSPFLGGLTGVVLASVFRHRYGFA